MKMRDLLIVLAAISVAILATIIVPPDQAFAIFISVIGGYLLFSGLTEIRASLTGIFSPSATSTWWGGFLVSVGISWLVYRGFPELPFQFSLLIFITGIIFTLLLARKVEEKSRKVEEK